ncbi:MAG: CBS domain-containing protein [Nitrosopumilaceae archaeon]|nr:CBS domain-containing protein [Nitrosopumilaceae archaeon]NIU00916.1 CBS domain-containing protein [Nitrosopumilaceae archaeon]NIU87369.1 CBS domain-containing protein [Nitrosopumilaceae archaeon]NIV65897.1 CBS domain-containing protein [Nitrosopumilaceae archaeon]NIX61518.1 CBS domain-containing protein [Nitrosopumilaceae archaeon]
MITDTIFEHFADVYNKKIDSLIKKPITVDPSDRVSKVINKLSQYNTYGAFHQDDNRILTTETRTLLRVKGIAGTKVEQFLYPIRSVKKRDTINDASNIMAHYRLREIPVVDKKNNLIGAIYAKDILKLMNKNDNKWIKASLIHTQNPITISSTDSLGTARKLMNSKKIDHLPVIKNGIISQVLTSYHVLTNIPSEERLGKELIGQKKVRKFEAQVGNIGTTRIQTCDARDNLNNILSSMLKTDTTCSLVSLWDTLQGIITYRDILSLLAPKMESEIPLYIIGLPEDQNTELIVAKFKNTLEKVRKVYNQIQEARISIKQHRSGRRKEGKYDVTALIITPRKSYNFKDVGFDLGNVVEQTNKKLMRSLTQRAKKRDKPSIRKIGKPVAPR